MREIKIKHRQIHNVDRMEVCDPIDAQAISELTGKRTVSDKDIVNLRRLGLIVVDLDQELKALFTSK